jgi:enterochelin esterase-like enzyme
MVKAKGIISILASLSIAVAVAQDQPLTRLESGRSITRTIRSGEVQRYQISARTGDFLRGKVSQDGITVNLKGFFPDGSKIRSFSGPPTGTKGFRFVAEAAGDYRLELTATTGGRPEGRYTITLEPAQPLAERLSTPVPESPYTSPRIRVLENQLESGDRQALARFWDHVRQEGTPLVDEIPNDLGHVLATFIWQATFEIHNVLILWNPYATEHPDDYQMRRLKDTDVWYKTLRLPRGARFLYQLSPNDTLTRSPNAQRFATAQGDPLNRRRQPPEASVTKYEVSSIAELPGATPQRWSDPRPGAPVGELHKTSVESAVLGNQRSVTVYTPPGYQKEGPACPWLLLFDADTYQSQVPAPVILDNLIAERRIAPMVAVLVNYPTQGARERELFANPHFADFVSQELVPWVSREYHVSTDPTKNVIGGLSAGGFAAAYLALDHSEIFGNVISQSGAFWWAPERDEGEEPNWLAREYASRPRQPVKFYLEAGMFENDIKGSGGQILETSRTLRDVLRAKGYDVVYHEFPGGHDYLTWRGSFADALLAMVGARQ